jgi:hypothetical protein
LFKVGRHFAVGGGIGLAKPHPSPFRAFPLKFSYPYSSLIRLDFDSQDTFPDREGYNWVKIVLENVGITNHLYYILVSEVSDLSTTLRFATSCDHLWWAGKMTAQVLSRTFPRWERLQ